MSATTHEAVLGGARWRLTLHPDGRWDVARRCGVIWDDVFAGTGGMPAVREAVDSLREIWAAGEMLAGQADHQLWVMRTLADVAERSTT